MKREGGSRGGGGGGGGGGGVGITRIIIFKEKIFTFLIMFFILNFIV